MKLKKRNKDLRKFKEGIETFGKKTGRSIDNILAFILSYFISFHLKALLWASIIFF
jgi:hypothetical protein